MLTRLFGTLSAPIAVFVVLFCSLPAHADTRAGGETPVVTIGGKILLLTIQLQRQQGASEEHEAPWMESEGPPLDEPEYDLATRRTIQESLAVLGFDPGAVDGEIGSETRQAIREFQDFNGDAVTGFLTATQMQELVQRASSTTPESPRQPDRQITDASPVAGPDAQTILSRDRGDVRRAQELLNALGHDAGRPDGAFGPRTRSALRAFQLEMGISPVSNDLTLGLLKRLELEIVPHARGHERVSAEQAPSSVEADDLFQAHGILMRHGLPVISGRDIRSADDVRANRAWEGIQARWRLQSSPELVTERAEALWAARAMLQGHAREDVLGPFAENDTGSFSEFDLERRLAVFRSEYLPGLVTQAPTLPLEVLLVTPLTLGEYDFDRGVFPVRSRRDGNDHFPGVWGPRAAGFSFPTDFHIPIDAAEKFNRNVASRRTVYAAVRLGVRGWHKAEPDTPYVTHPQTGRSPRAFPTNAYDRWVFEAYGAELYFDANLEHHAGTIGINFEPAAEEHAAMPSAVNERRAGGDLSGAADAGSGLSHEDLERAGNMSAQGDAMTMLQSTVTQPLPPAAFGIPVWQEKPVLPVSRWDDAGFLDGRRPQDIRESWLVLRDLWRIRDRPELVNGRAEALRVARRVLSPEQQREILGGFAQNATATGDEFELARRLDDFRARLPDLVGSAPRLPLDLVVLIPLHLGEYDFSSGEFPVRHDSTFNAGMVTQVAGWTGLAEHFSLPRTIKADFDQAEKWTASGTDRWLYVALTLRLHGWYEPDRDEPYEPARTPAGNTRDLPEKRGGMWIFEPKEAGLYLDPELRERVGALDIVKRRILNRPVSLDHSNGEATHSEVDLREVEAASAASGDEYSVRFVFLRKKNANSNTLLFTPEVDIRSIRRRNNSIEAARELIGEDAFFALNQVTSLNNHIHFNSHLGDVSVLAQEGFGFDIFALMEDFCRLVDIGIKDNVDLYDGFVIAGENVIETDLHTFDAEKFCAE